MDSTPLESHHHKTSASKLPIKRKNPLENSPPLPEPHAPPFKFHRIWTEPDEIRFLQGLVDCSSQNLAFPRDLGIFYARFSNTMSQPYTKSQLSEKLRRLRKKFRIISTRLSNGLDRSQLSIHDVALYDLSKHLWHPDFVSTSPFNGARNVGFNSNDEEMKRKSGLVGIKVDFSPTLPIDEIDGNFEFDFIDDGNDSEIVRLSEVNVEFEDEKTQVDNNNNKVQEEDSMGEITAKVAMNVFDECFNEMKRKQIDCGETGAESFRLRWQKQRIDELDALGSRIRLVLEQSIQKKYE